MKYAVIFLLFFSNMAFADDCKITTVTIEHDGKMETESSTICKEGNEVTATVKVGDIILENEVGRSKVKKYFTYRNARCRMFTEHHVVNKQLHDHYGVICETQEGGPDWVVVDKW
jgi:hypothetical protein